MKAFRAAGLLFPWRHLKGPRKGEIDWKPLAHHAVLRVLHNPRYAGCFTYGRHAHRKQPGGKLNTTLLPREEWISFIPGAHPGYITLEQHDANLARLAANAAAHGRDRRSGPPREGPALLQGIIICGRCGLRMTVRYHQRPQPVTGSPHLHVPARRHRERTAGLRRDPRRGPGPGHRRSCSSTPSPRSPSKPPCRCPPNSSTGPPKPTRCAPPTSNAPSYHADLARRRYLAVDPANRLVAGTLEADWNTALRALNDAQEAYDKARKQHAGQLTDAQKARIQQLATDLPAHLERPRHPGSGNASASPGCCSPTSPSPGPAT